MSGIKKLFEGVFAKDKENPLYKVAYTLSEDEIKKDVISLSELVSMYNSLGDPDKFKDMMDKGVIRNGVNDSKTECFIYHKGKDYCFELKGIGNGAEWCLKNMDLSIKDLK